MLQSSIPKITCVGCGALVPDSDGGTDERNNASAGCFALYSDVSGRHFSDIYYGSIIDFSSDAYSLQHPGTPSPRTIKSNAVHFISLYLQLEKGYNRLAAARAKQQAATDHKDTFTWLEPPASMGLITVVNIHAEQDPVARIELVKHWAATVWAAWHTRHAIIGKWAALLNA
jgi:hypothetical protein